MRFFTRARGLGLALVLGLGSGCITARPAVVSADAVVGALRAGKLAWEHPFRLDEAAAEQVRERLGLHGSEEERLRRAVHFLTSPTGLGFQYVPQHTLTAREAFRAPRGDCMTYAALLHGVARALEVPTSFILARQAPLYTEDAEAFLSTGHIALSAGGGPSPLVVDFAARLTGWQHLRYEEVEEATAAALFYNNRAMEALLRGQPEQAEALLRRLLAVVPQVPQLHANLGMVLLRQGRAGEALALLEEALRRFPEHPQLWSNTLQAARRAGHFERAEALLAQVERVAGSDPSLHLLRAQEAWRRRELELAADHVEQALAVVPDSPLLLAWRVRLLLAGQHTREGLALYARLRRDFPSSTWVEELPRHYPELLAVASSPPLPGAALSRRTKLSPASGP
ncbi:MAG TPA: tetratricopeptide repeat protein [Myxococcaceae bacterium]|nr:tetratricopeptide repeat protein [Myxococcaceae bacterium]